MPFLLIFLPTALHAALKASDFVSKISRIAKPVKDDEEEEEEEEDKELVGALGSLKVSDKSTTAAGTGQQSKKWRTHQVRRVCTE